MADGLGNGLGQVGSTSIATGAVGTAALLDGGVATADLADTSVTTAKLGAESVTAPKQAFVGTGSPTGFGLSVQTGTVTASDVVVTASYGTAFAAAPILTFGIAESGALATAPGMAVGIAAGSFTFLGQSGLTYNYVAIGSGAL